MRRVLAGLQAGWFSGRVACRLWWRLATTQGSLIGSLPRTPLVMKTHGKRNHMKLQQVNQQHNRQKKAMWRICLGIYFAQKDSSTVHLSQWESAKRAFSVQGWGTSWVGFRSTPVMAKLKAFLPHNECTCTMEARYGRLFSSAGMVISTKRSSLLPDNADLLIFLSENSH